ncbi:MAG: transcription antitermination factor NusB [Clostridia bacterium]|nr:transcription antitermination factor NusB [Clostridia bacterium]
MSRSSAREIAMKLLYSRLLGGAGTPADIAAESGAGAALDEEDSRYIEEIIAGVSEKSAELDELVQRYAIGWSSERIARVDLSILRVAIYEMLYRADVPAGAAIDEAVELAKRFGGERSYAFVNGILGSVAKSLQPEPA